ncbi:MAG: hypothetical protein L0387_34285 [Acidobacteria bacterium]|nr:hypothetical protein [Acidobacteriota bacterium]
MLCARSQIYPFKQVLFKPLRKQFPVLTKAVLSLLFFLTISLDICGMWATMTTPVPIERLLKNVSNHIQKNPKDWHGYYVTGRLHSMAFAQQTEKLDVVLEKDKMGKATLSLPSFHPAQSILQERSAKKGISKPSQNHLAESIRNYQKATELAAKEPLPWLGLGWVLEQGSVFGLEMGVPWRVTKSVKEIPAEEKLRVSRLVKGLGAATIEKRQDAFQELKSDLEEALPILLEARRNKNAYVLAGISRLLAVYWKQHALDAYRQAYELALASDLKKKHLGPEANSSISLEAGEGILRILKGQDTDENGREEIDRIQKSIATLERKPRAVTPIVFPLKGQTSLESLLAKDRYVSFDLDGSGKVSLWPWIQSTTGMLAWDPQEAGHIQSGLQLFGSVTWWMFWKDGYHPLATLDDDRDGWLSGEELKGVAVWRDRNENGISEPGEVVPVQSIGILRIAAHANAVRAGVPFNPQGIHFSNGTTVPTYDWTPVQVHAGKGRLSVP